MEQADQFFTDLEEVKSVQKLGENANGKVSYSFDEL